MEGKKAQEMKGMARCVRITEGELPGLCDRFEVQRRERQSYFEVSRLRIRSLLMSLIETKDVLEVEYF